MESDDEVKGEGNSYTTEFRQYDPRIGRWLSRDPLFANFPWQSPYVAFDNNPIFYKDPKGLAAEGGDDDGEKEKKPSKRKVKSLQKKLDNILEKSKELTSLDLEKANEFINENGGELVDWKDSDGNKRYSVKLTETDNEGGGTNITRKTFNNRKWNRLSRKTDRQVNKLKAMAFSVTGQTNQGMIGVTSGVSYLYGIGMEQKTSFTTTFLLTDGPDKGIHKMITEDGNMYGVNYEASWGFVSGTYSGYGDMSTESLEGKGYFAGGDFFGGVSVWKTTERGKNAWVGFSVTAGPAIGLMFGYTYTTILQ